ncbi:Nephrocystin-3 [Talaromyces pinophilus]|nr:Nephrocystin-3 [Talaromyces pinophilus]
MTFVFWIDARTRARFEQCFQDIAERYKVRCRFENTANIVNLVLRWLENQLEGNWVLVFDGVGDAENAEFLARHVPTHAWRTSGSVIVTTRSEEVALKFVPKKEDVVVLDPMDEAHALKLLGRKLDMPFDSIEDAKKLVAALEYIPLAIVQAAAYINRAKPPCSLRQYLDKLKEVSSKSIVSDPDGERFNQDVTLKPPILSTWNISFDYLWRNRPSATDLLSLMSCADHQIIPDFLVRFSAETITEVDDTDDTVSQKDERNEMGLTRFSTLPTFGKDIRLLSDFSLITASAETFDMAEPVQLATQAWFKSRGQLDRWGQEFVYRMDAVFPYQDDENITWDLPRILLPHAPTILAYRPTDKLLLNRWSNLAARAGRYALITANLVDAKRLLEAALEAQGSTLGLAHNASFDTTGNLSTVYVRLKEESKLRYLWKQSLDSSLEVLGAGHPRTRTIMDCLAKVYYIQHCWEDTEVLQKQLIESSEASLGAAHPKTLEARDWLANIWERQDRLVEAEALWKELIETLKDARGREHADVLEKSRELALFYYRHGRWTDAEAVQVSVMSTCRRVLGTGHQLTLNTMRDLAITYRRRGRQMNAIALLFLAIWLRKDSLGRCHPNTKADFELMREWNPQFTWAMVPSRAATLSDTMVNHGV